MKNNDRLDGFGAAKPPACNQTEKNGRTELHMNQGKGDGGDVKREGLKGSERDLLKLRLDDGPHQKTTPKELLDNGHYQHGAK